MHEINIEMDPLPPVGCCETARGGQYALVPSWANDDEILFRHRDPEGNLSSRTIRARSTLSKAKLTMSPTRCGSIWSVSLNVTTI